MSAPHGGVVNRSGEQGSPGWAAQARESARRPDGRFGEQSHGDPGQVGLTEPGPLDEALAGHGLTAGDVPGIREAWAERFACLDGPGQRDVAEVLWSCLGDIDTGRHRGGPSMVAATPDGCGGFQTREVAPDDPLEPGEEYLIAVFTRNGGGNRDHTCDDEDASGCTGCANDAMAALSAYVADADDDFDHTYATFWFRPTPDALDTWQAIDQKAAARQVQARRELERIAAGETPPWRVLADPTEVRELVVRAERAKRQAAESGWERVVRDKAHRFARALATGRPLAADREEWIEHNYRRIHSSQVDRAIAARQQTTIDADRFDRIEAQLGALPPDVADYLRQSGSFRIDADTARRKRERAAQDLDRLIAEVGDAVTASDRRHAAALDARAEAERASEELWAAGWSGSWPPPPRLDPSQ